MPVEFPFNLPAATAWYATLYLVTLLMHVVFMTYVLAGTLLLAAGGVRGMLLRGAAGESARGFWHPVTMVLKDWMPFAVSAAITAGVAPLLFIQILYQQQFYTANLLSFHRWMAILPVLIVAFYLLYVLKAKQVEQRVVLRGLTAIVIAACMLFVAWSWVENHLLSLRAADWARQYESQAFFYRHSAIVPRLLFWIAAAFPTAAVLIAWQLTAGASGVEPGAARAAQRPLAGLALVTLVIATPAAWLVLGAVPAGAAHDPSFVTTSRAAAGMLVIAAVLQAAGWWGVASAGTCDGYRLAALTAGVGLFWIGALVLREASRLSALDANALAARHAEVGTTAGLIVFLVFAVLAVGTIAWVGRTVAGALRGGANRDAGA